MTQRSRRVRIEVPTPEQDRPQLARVGIIAAVGFAIGIAWPWLAGVDLVPRAPVENDKPPRQAAPGPSGPASARGSAVAGPAAAETEPQRTTEQGVEVGDALIVSCRDSQDRRLDTCDRIDFDRVAEGRLKALAGCEAAQGAAGTLSIGFDLDFEKNSIRRIVSGKSTTLSDEKKAALLDCARREFKGVSLRDLDHEHAGYLVYYLAKFIPPGAAVQKPEQDTEGEITEASGLATVGWNVAMVRSAPDPESEVRARVLYGTRVVVTGRKSDWYRVRYDGKGSEGWVHKNALGL